MAKFDFPVSTPNAVTPDGFGNNLTWNVPSFYVPGDPCPPYTGRARYGGIIGLHSYGQTGADVLSRFNLSRIHFGEKGYVVGGPDGLLDGSSQRRFNYWDPTANDFARIKAFCDAILSRFDLLYLAMVGYSNGGFLATQFSMQYPGYLDCLVTISCAGGDRDTTAVASQPVPRLHIHGDADATVLPAGDAAAVLPGTLSGHGGCDYGSGQSTGYTSVTNTVANQAARNGLGAGPIGSPGAAFDLVSTPAGNEATSQVWPGSVARSNIVEFWNLAGATHALNAVSGNELIVQWINNNARLRP